MENTQNGKSDRKSNSAGSSAGNAGSADGSRQKEIYFSGDDITTREFIELFAPEKQERIMITVTKRRYFDIAKGKVVTDQTVHRARYSLQNRRG